MTTVLRTIDRSVNKQAGTEQVIVLGDRCNALESFTNNSLPAIRVILENIKQPVEVFEAAAHLNPAQLRPEEKHQSAYHRYNEDFTDQSDEEATSTHKRSKAPKAGTSRTYNLGQEEASY